MWYDLIALKVSLNDGIIGKLSAHKVWVVRNGAKVLQEMPIWSRTRVRSANDAIADTTHYSPQRELLDACFDILGLQDMRSLEDTKWTI